MRIISALVALPILWTMIVPQYALAANLEPNETKTKIQENITIIEGKIYASPVSLSAAPSDFSGYMPVKSQEEIMRDEKLDKWKTKQGAMWKNLPQGKFTINASAYTAAADECGKNDGITSSGVKVQEKRTIACPPQFPFGAKLKIKGMGTYVCEDRGGAIKGNHIDIYMQTKKQAFAFGRKNLEAEIVN